MWLPDLEAVAGALAAEPFSRYQLERDGPWVRLHASVGDVVLLPSTLAGDADVLARARALRPGEVQVLRCGAEAELAGLPPDGDAGDLGLPATAPQLERAIRTALDVLYARQLIAIARLIGSERDLDRLLALILEASREVTGADAGSMYVVEGDDPDPRRRTLHFRAAQNASRAVDFQAARLPIDEASIVGRAVLAGEILNVPDLYAPDCAHRHDRSFDERLGYQTRSMLVVPMTSAAGEVIGAVQLINRKRRFHAPLVIPGDFAAEVVPFAREDEDRLRLLAGQAGICVENALLYRAIERLFEGFVIASVTAIEQRDPTTSGHSWRVAQLTCGLGEAVNRVTRGPLAEVALSEADLRELRYAAVLHDFGKVGVREPVLVKARKLYDPQREALRLRFDLARRALEVESLRARLELALAGDGADARVRAAEAERELAAALAALEDDWQFVLRCDLPTVLEQGEFERLRTIARRVFRDAHGEPRPLLTDPEVAALSIRRGSLTSEERREIESHVVHTRRFLDAIPWTRDLRRVPAIAGAHHEKLDGTGYPLGVAGEAIPVQARMMTIADIFDALAASDRPYKKAVPPARALDILADEVRQGKLDGALYDLFVEAGVWRITTAG